ncbi:MAG: serine hydrolase domain-containing protein [Gammaproteobacteria bacterium]
MPLPTLRELTALILPSVIVSCGGDGGAVGPAVLPVSDEPFAGVATVIEEFAVADMALVVGDADGTIWFSEKGTFELDQVQLIASASKWLGAAVIMALVEQGVMALDDRPQDYLDYWTSAAADPRSRVTLQQLLSFTSGFDHDTLNVSCVEESATTLQSCAQNLYSQALSFEPGTAFSYGPAHLAVAGAMAEQATAQSFRTLAQLQVSAALNLANTDVLRPSPANPRVAGGWTSTARDYGAFLRGLLSGEYLGSVRATMLEDQTAEPVIMVTRPAVIDDNQFDFHYASGAWRECTQPQWDETCDALGIVASPGAFGWYPWIDFENGYYAVIAMRESVVNGQSATAAAMDLALVLRPLIEDALR